MTTDTQLGWIKLYRKLLNSPIFSSEKGLKIWVWCLLKATHEGYEQYVGRSLVQINPGEFVFGRKAAAHELRMSESTVRNWIEVLKKDSYLDIKPYTKYSIISIQKWDEYQGSNSKVDNKKTTDEQQMDTNKNVKNVKNNIYSSRKCLTDELCVEVANQYSVSEGAVRDIRDSLNLYCKSKGKKYSNYKATLQTWVRKSLSEKKITKVIKNQLPKMPEISEKEREANRAIIAQTRQKLVGGMSL